MDVEERISAIREAVASWDSDRLAEMVADMACYCHEEDQRDVFGPFDGTLFDSIIDTLGDPRFQSMPGSWHLLSLFEFNWGLLSDRQKGELIEAIKEVYEKFSDWMAFFVMCELLGRFSRNENAFAILKRLYESLKEQSGTTPETARGLIAHGYRCLVKRSSDSALRADAIRELHRLAVDHSEVVREEAREMLLSLETKQSGGPPTLP